MSTNEETVNQDDNDLARERDLLASLIEKLKCEIDDSKNCNKFLESSNKALVDKLKGEIKDFKTKIKSLESSNNHLKEANNELSNTNQLMFKDLKKFQAELDRYHDVNYASKVATDCAKAKGDLMSYKMESEKKCYYADHMHTILGVYTDLDEFTDLQCDYVDQVVRCERLEKELSKINITSKSFEVLQQHAIDLELALQQYLKAQLQDKDIAIRKPFRFSDSLEKKDFSKLVTAQILPQNVKPVSKNTNVIAPGMYKMDARKTQTRTTQLPQDLKKTNKRVSFSIGVIATTSVSRPQLKRNQLEDRVLPNNSEVKTKVVEGQRINFKFSKNKTSITACNNSLNAKTSHVNFVSVTCGKCVLNDNHDICALHYINGMNSRTKMPMAVPIRVPLCPILHCLIILLQLVEIILFIVDSRCLKHMTGNLKLLSNFVEKFLSTVKFGNDQITPILGYGDLVQGNVESINGKKYVLVIVDDYSRYTWTDFLRTKDETPEVLNDFLRLVQRGLHA
ncbi:retrovirus-related pol polyprotein from transposon TNT 1-94 [Tanacetum coccineum]